MGELLTKISMMLISEDDIGPLWDMTRGVAMRNPMGDSGEQVRIFATLDEMDERDSIYDMFNNETDFTGVKVHFQIRIPPTTMKSFFEFMDAGETGSTHRIGDLKSGEVWLLRKFVDHWTSLFYSGKGIYIDIEEGCDYHSCTIKTLTLTKFYS